MVRRPSPNTNSISYLRFYLVSIILPSTLFPTKTIAMSTVSFFLSGSPTPTRSASNSSNPNLGAIVGGALGGSVGLAIILLLLLLWYSRRRSDRRQNDVVFDRTALVSGQSTTSGTSLPFGPSHASRTSFYFQSLTCLI